RKSFPTSLKILLLLGKAEQHLGNDDAAETDLRAAVAMAPPSQRDAVLAYVGLSELLSARGRLGEAKSVLDDARKRLAASGTLDRALGEVAELQGEHDLAVAQYRAAIAKDPRDVAAHFRLAVTLRRIRKFDVAGSELDQVAAVDKDYPGLSLERGLLFEESGDVEKAIDQFKAALARAPDDPDLQLRVGSAYVAIGRADDAIPMLRKVLQGRPTSAEAHHYLGRALMLKGSQQQAEALRYLKRAVDLDPNRAEFHVYLAWAANEATPAQLELARDQIDRAMALDTLNAETYWQKGVLERMQGAFEDAIKDEKRALELRPSRYEAHATLAECYEDRNDEGSAMAEWAKAIAGDTDVAGQASTDRHPYWRYKYGKLLMERANASAALPLLMSAATTIEKSEQRPGWMAPLEFLTAEALRKTGRKLDAADHYRRFLEIAPVSSPDRADAQAALTRLTGAR
ncbi:MAG: tetratricopeptide repeat protein, partial [Myxococcota bacterium]|nr:tetratricopeptide repeat protein [Myxococcota bacterium]